MTVVVVLLVVLPDGVPGVVWTVVPPGVVETVVSEVVLPDGVTVVVVADGVVTEVVGEGPGVTVVVVLRSQPVATSVARARVATTGNSLLM